jgi:hypothetical protein
MRRDENHWSGTGSHVHASCESCPAVGQNNLRMRLNGFVLADVGISRAVFVSAGVMYPERMPEQRGSTGEQGGAKREQMDEPGK